MRLRSPSRRELESHWVQPSRSEHRTLVGSLDSSARGVVDAAGLVGIEGRTWSLDWWIGAEDRWRVPARELSVRQALVANSPVVETRVRVPSGDAVQRVYAARGVDGAEALVVEIHNDSKVPFAVALALRPYDLSGTGRLGRLELDGTIVRVDGTPVLVLPRSPGRLAFSDLVADSAAVVFAGEAEPVRAAEVTCAHGLANGALLFPLAHTATLRVVVPLLAGAAVNPPTLPSADQVAAGWASQTRGGARIEVPNRRLRDGLAACTRFLFLGGPDPAIVTALDLAGFGAEARTRLLAEDLHDAGAAQPGRTLEAIGCHWALTRDVEIASTLVPLIAALLSRLGRAEVGADAVAGHAALPSIAELLAAVGEHRAASDVRAVAGRASAATPSDPDVEELLATASSTWTWPSDTGGPDVTANATLVRAVRGLVVREVDGGLALSPSVPPAWLGAGWEVHDLPTAEGVLSYAVRWHGERPALLWELEPHAGRPEVRLTIPGLDPAWTTTQNRGEALLSPVALPHRPKRRGLTIPVTIEPMRPGRP